jgi:hypothetical protein
MTARCLKALSLTVLCMPRSLAEPLVHGIPSCSELLTDNFVSSSTLDWAGSILLFLWDVRYGTNFWSLTLGESILHINVYTTLVIELSCSLPRPHGDYFHRIHLVIRTILFIALTLGDYFLRMYLVIRTNMFSTLTLGNYFLRMHLVDRTILFSTSTLGD